MPDYWDPSLVDPTAVAHDGMLIRSVGGRSGPLALENGAELTFPWARIQRISGTLPGTIYAQDQTDGVLFNSLSLRSPKALAAGDQAFLDLRCNDAGVPQINMGTPDTQVLINDTLIQIVMGGGILLLPDYLSVTASTTVDIEAGTSMSLTTDATTGTDITLNANRDLFLYADNDVNANAFNGDLTLGAKLSMVMSNDTTSGTDITIQSNRDLFLSADSDVEILATTGNIILNSLPITGAWNTSFSQVVKQNGTTVSSTVTSSRYWKVGRTVIWMFWSTVTGTGTASTAITVTTPFTGALSGAVAGVWVQYDASLNQFLLGGLRFHSTTEVSAVLHGSNNWVGISGFTEAIVNTDQILGLAIFEATS